MESFGTETHTKELDTIYEHEQGDIEDIVFNESDLMYDFKARLRLFRKNLASVFRKNLKKEFKQVLYITLDEKPLDYIQAFRMQYPDKEIKILTCADNIEGLEKTHISFEYYLQNRMNTAVLYKFPKSSDNIEIYGLYSPAFSGLDKSRLQYMAPFIKASRICAKKLKPDIIHCDNIPFFLGGEFESKLPYPVKVVQIIKDFAKFEENKTEAFWAAINLVDKKSMRKLCRDKIIKKCIASLFNLHNTRRFYQMRECLEFIYQNYFKFRKYIDKCEDIDENILFNRMNARVLKLFPHMAYENDMFYNSMYYTLKKTDFWAVISKTYYNEILKRPELSGKIYKRIERTKNKSSYVSYGCTIPNTAIYQKFTTENFRELRSRNKKYLLKEFSRDRIKAKFVDNALFKTDDYIIRGYLDSFYDAPLIFASYKPDIFEQGIDIAFNTILKLFELNKNVQFIINIPDGLKNNYIKSWVEFVEKNPSFNGRWLFIDGEINLNRFFASSDMFFIPKRANETGIEHYCGMKYGCVPVASRSGIYNDTIADIFDDITYGCGFKTKTSLITNDDANEIYLHAVTKALNLYSKNPASWNLLIKNAMNYNSGWTFEIIEKYNRIYNNL